ncbi:MAG: triose-phosphate isomerase [Desulfococcus sp. 4484_241]|nr:MAG: triose-phosphate isomerase [Desulfococcus sp. 4484_241]
MSSAKPLIAGNWKMHKTCEESAATASELAKLVRGVSGRDVLIAPPFTSLTTVRDAISGSGIALAAQNLHWETKGAFTGEISAPMLVSAGCTHVIIGHSERRLYFHETDETVNRKVKAAQAAGLIPIVCIGETEEQRETGKTFNVLDKQIRNGLEGLDLNDADALVIAYEPVWAIGTGKTATSSQAQEVHAFVRSIAGEMFGKTLVQGMRILYGGSVKPSNIAELMAMEDIDGALVGGASLDAETFAGIVKY